MSRASLLRLPAGSSASRFTVSFCSVPAAASFSTSTLRAMVRSRKAISAPPPDPDSPACPAGFAAPNSQLPRPWRLVSSRMSASRTVSSRISTWPLISGSSATETCNSPMRAISGRLPQLAFEKVTDFAASTGVSEMPTSRSPAMVRVRPVDAETCSAICRFTSSESMDLTTTTTATTIAMSRTPTILARVFRRMVNPPPGQNGWPG